MRYNGIIENKLRIIEEKLEAIESWRIDSLKTFSESTLLQNGAERALQVAVEVMIDVSERILALEKKSPRPTSTENLKALEDMGILQDASIYTAMIRFRNFIVHRYEKVDTEIVYDILQNKLANFRLFIDEIRRSSNP